MEIYTVERTDNSITLGIKNANTSILTPLIDCLNNDPAVKLVRFIETHPELDDRRLAVIVNDGDPVDALTRAADEVRSYFSKDALSSTSKTVRKTKSPDVAKSDIYKQKKESDVYRVDGENSDVYRVDGEDSDVYRADGN